MKICLVCRAFPPESGISGTGTYMHSIAKCLKRLGHAVIVISYSQFGDTQTEEGGIIVYRIRPRNLRGSRIFRKYIPVWLLTYSFAIRKKILQLHKIYGFDIIQIPEWGAEGFFYSWNPCCPFVVKVHGPLFLNHAYDKNPKTRMLKFLENWMEKSVVEKANAVIFSSRAMENMTKAKWRIDFKNSIIIENPIDLDQFLPKKNGHRKNAKKEIILYVGRLEYRKGIQVLVQAVPKIIESYPNVKFIILGKDTKTGKGGRSILAETKEFLKKNGLIHCVEFIGPQKRDNLLKYYHDCDIFVMPSLFEPVGFTAIEAMACEKVVVVSSNSGIAEKIENCVSGFLFKPGDADDLAEKIHFILKQSIDQRRKIAKSARNVLRRQSFEHIGRRLEDLYSRVIHLT